MFGRVGNTQNNNQGVYNPYANGQSGMGGATAPMMGGASAPMGEKPKKYVKVNGVMKLNPEYKNYMAGQNKPATTATGQDLALPVVTNMDDHAEYNEATVAAGEPEIELAESTNATIEMMQEPEIAAQVGMDGDELVDGLGQIFNRYEVPMGLMNKLMMLSECDKIEFLVDDSGSMSLETDARGPHGETQTRWKEAEGRILDMIEVLAYVPLPPVEVKFLNRPNTVTLNRNGNMRPEQFIQDARQKVSDAFRSGPRGGTPMLQAMQRSMGNGPGSVARYVLGDGVPNGGSSAVEQIKGLVKNRNNPEGNPVTFLSCTNEDDQVEWMKEVEEVAPYCAEIDDFNDEAAEVKKDQGDVFPFTKGFHLICQLVAAMNPHDLDAMDESVPFTKTTLDNLLGIKHTEQDYHRYFDGFIQAQRARPVQSAMDNVKKNANFQSHYNEFLNAPNADSIAFVRDFKNQLKQAEAGGGAGRGGFGGMFRNYA